MPHWRREQIAAGPDRLDERRLARVLLDLLTQAADQDVDAALIGSGDAPLRKIEQLVARENPARTLAKGVQEIDLGPVIATLAPSGLNSSRGAKLSCQPAKE